MKQYNINQNNVHCCQCKEDFIYLPEEAFFDDKGYGYSTKLVTCPYCKQINIVKHIEDRAMRELNHNDWEYRYDKK